MKPEINMGATVSYGVDSHAMTIVEVSLNGKTVIVQRDSVKATGGSYSNQWITTPNPQGATMEFTLRKNDRYVLAGDSAKSGTTLHVGARHEYYSYEF